MFLKTFFRDNLKKNNEIYKMYLESKISKSIDTADTTYKTYKSNMNLFLKWFHTKDKGYYLLDKKTLNEFPEIIDRYMMYCVRERGNNKVTVNNKITALSSFYIWARRTRKIIFNPALDIERQQKSKLDKRRNSYFLTIEQIKFMKQQMELQPQKFDIRSKIIFNIFIDSAIRIGEMTRLKISNLDLKNDVFINIKQKGGEMREVYISEETKVLINKYLIWRQENNIKIDDFLITKYNGKYKNMSRETIRARVRKIGKILNIEDLYPHTLRKTIVNIVTKLGSIDDGALIAYHKNTTVTRDHYIQEMTAIEKTEKIKKIRALAQF